MEMNGIIIEWNRIELWNEIQCEDRKSTRLNSSHLVTSYAVFCLKKKKQTRRHLSRRPPSRRTYESARCPGVPPPPDRLDRPKGSWAAGARPRRCRVDLARRAPRT